jgi:beta-lactamase regulating signal transducer with metallopeptidase domain
MTASLVVLFARGAIVLAVALLAMRLLHRASAALRHAVLASSLAAALALPAIALVVPTWHTGAIANATMPATAEPIAAPFAERSALAAPAVTTAATAAPRPAIPWRTLAAALWLVGLAIGVLRVGVGSLRARRLAARGTPAPDAGAHVRAAWRALDGRDAPPSIVISAEVEAPIVVGSLAPIVVVPRASASWTAERWRVVLLHELAHVRRGDGIANLVAQLACCLHWLDPLAWLAARRLRVERELAADDAVLRSGARASSYADHLVAIASAASRRAPAAAVAMAEPSRFESRIAALLDERPARDALGARRAIAVLAGAAALAAVAACVSPDAAPASPAGPAPAVTIAPTDPALQAAAGAELATAMTAQHATGAIAIVLDARTGAPLAIATRGDGDARAQRIPGSTMKPFTIAAALEAGVVTPDTKLDCEHGTRTYGDRTLVDASPNEVLDVGGALAVSSNVCTAKLAEPLGDRLGDALRRYHFAAPSHIDTRSFEGAAISAGEGLRASALELATAYTAFADGGVLHVPGDAPGNSGDRVMSAGTARAVMTMLERVVDGADGTGHAARIDGVRVAGKTGTAGTVAGHNYASFVGIVPADAPRFVVLVAFDGVAGAGGEVAAPVFAKIAAHALAK